MSVTQGTRRKWLWLRCQTLANWFVYGGVLEQGSVIQPRSPCSSPCPTPRFLSPGCSSEQSGPPSSIRALLTIQGGLT